jgi:hypothetical protein
VLVSSGGLGREVNFLLRALTAPGAEQVLSLACTAGVREAANRVATWLRRAGVRAGPAGEEMWRSYASLADADSRRAFLRTLRAVIDPGGQTVGAADRLYLAAQIPTLIVWGARDPFIPVRHTIAAHEAIPGSRLEIFPGVGHYPHCEAPARFVDVLVDFITSTAPAQVFGAALARAVPASSRRRRVEGGSAANDEQTLPVSPGFTRGFSGLPECRPPGVVCAYFPSSRPGGAHRGRAEAGDFQDLALVE